MVLHLLGQVLCLYAPVAAGAKSFLGLSISLSILGLLIVPASLLGLPFTDLLSFGIAEPVLGSLVALFASVGLALLGFVLGLTPFLLFLGSLAQYAEENRLCRRLRLLGVICLLWPILLGASFFSMLPGSSLPHWLGSVFSLGGVLTALVAAVMYFSLLGKLQDALLRRAGSSTWLWL
jgi:hypothetical protein